MAYASKPKVICICLHCNAKKEVRPYKQKTFRYCSNKCKWAAKRHKVARNKLPFTQRIFAKCHNLNCDKGRYILPSANRLGRYKYCSLACKKYVQSKQYKLDLEKKKQQEQQQVKRSIWFIR